MERRQFLTRIIAGAAVLAAAPLTALAEQNCILYGDGVHDDTEALQAWLDNKPVYWPDGVLVEEMRPKKHFYITGPVFTGNPGGKEGAIDMKYCVISGTQFSVYSRFFY